MGKYSSLALDPNGYIHISYFDRSHGYLKYARGGSASIDLSSTLDNGTLILSWSPTIGASEYWVFGAANQAHFLPGTWPDYEYRLVTLPSTENSWVTDLGVGDQSANWCYLIIAASDSELEIGRSNRVGEFDFEGDLP